MGAEREWTIHDTNTGRKVGTTDDGEAAFLAAIEAARAREPVYCVLGTGGPAGFADRVRATGVPVVEDSDLADGALIVAGNPDEWPPK